MISPEGENLIFILSAPRAGSTLLGALLSNGGQATCPAEPWIQLAYAATSRSQTIVNADYDQTLANEAIEQFMGPSIALEASLKKLIVRRYSEIAQEAGTTVLIDKTPRYYHIPDFLASQWPLAKLVWLKRSPLDIIASCKTHWHIGIEEQMGAAPSPHRHDCTTAFFNLATFFQKHTSAPQIKYEDLVSDDGSSLARLSRELGLTTSSPNLHYAPPKVGTDEQVKFRFGDDKVWQHNTPHRQSIGNWKTALNKSEVSIVLTRLGRSCFEHQGYGQEYDEALAWVGGSLDERQSLSFADLGNAGHFAINRKYVAAVSEIQTLRTQLNDLGEKLIDACNDKDTAVASRNEAEAREADLSRQFKVSEADRQARVEVIQQQGDEISKLGAEIERLQSELHRLYTKVDSVKADRNLLNARLADLKENFDASEQDRLKRGKVIEEQGLQLAKLQAQFSHRLAELTSLYESTDQLRNKNNLLQAQLEDLRGNFEAVEADRIARGTVIEAQGHQISELQKLVWLTEQDRDYWKNRSIPTTSAS